MSPNLDSAKELIDLLDLLPHDEGGWFRETFRSAATVDCPSREGIQRPQITTIHYLIDKTAPRGLLHRNASDIVHFHEAGGVLRYIMLTPEGKLSEAVIGPGHDRQLVVPGGVWKASELLEGDCGMVGEAVSPGFDYRDRQIASREDILAAFPQHAEKLLPFLHETKSDP